MTGAHRSATVRAPTAVRVLEVTKMALAPILDASPELVDRFPPAEKGARPSSTAPTTTRSFSLLDQGGFAEPLIRGFFGQEFLRGMTP